MPVGDGGDVGAVLAGVGAGMQAGVLQLLPQLRVAGGEARDVVEDVDREPVPVQVVEHDHVEGGRGGAALLEAVHVEVVVPVAPVAPTPPIVGQVNNGLNQVQVQINQADAQVAAQINQFNDDFSKGIAKANQEIYRVTNQIGQVNTALQSQIPALSSQINQTVTSFKGIVDAFKGIF